MTSNKTPDNNDDYDDEVTAQYKPRLYISADWNNCTPRSHFHQLERKLKLQESRAAARKPRDAASVLFGRSSPTTVLTSIRLAMLRKPRFRAPNMLAQNTI